MNKITHQPIKTNEKEQPDIKKAFSIKTIRKGIIYFVFLSLTSFTVLFFYNNTTEVVQVLKNVNLFYLPVALFMAGLDLWIGGYRNHIFAARYQPEISKWVCFKANLANIFLGAVTPSQSGGGPAQIYIWYRAGITLTQAFTISLVNWFSTLLFFPLSALLAIYFIGDEFSGNLFPLLLKSGFSIFTTVFLVVIIAFWKPIWIGKGARLLAGVLGNLNPKWKEKLNGWGEKTYEAVQGYQVSCKETLLKYPWLMPASFLLTVVLYFNKFCLAYVLVLGMGATADFWTVIAVQVVLQFVLYFAPSPGGSGIAEFSIAVLMASILATDLIPVFTLLHRIFLLFLPAVIGSFVVLRELKKHAAE